MEKLVLNLLKDVFGVGEVSELNLRFPDTFALVLQDFNPLLLITKESPSSDSKN